MRNRYFLLLFLFVASLMGCESSNKEGEAISSVVIPEQFTSLILDNQPTTKSVTFTSNVDWQVEVVDSASLKKAEWIYITPTSGSAGSGTVEITVYENIGGDSRKATITIGSVQASAKIDVTQSGVEPIFLLDKSSGSVLSDAGMLNVDITSNFPWKVSKSPSWITVSPLSGNGNKSVTLDYKANSTLESRTGVVVFVTEYGELEYTLEQGGLSSELTLARNIDNVTYKKGEVMLMVSSNIAWKAKDIPSWIELSPSSGDSSQNVTVKYQENTTTNVRKDTIIFANEKGESKYIISQGKFVAVLALDTYTKRVDSKKGAFDLKVTANLDWEVVGSTAEWITLSSDSGTGNKTIRVDYKNNSSEQLSRTDTITVAFTNQKISTNKVQFVLVQDKYIRPISLDLDTVSVATLADEFDVEVTSNTSWNVTNIPDWVKLSTTSGVGNKTVTVSYTKNTLVTKRKASLAFKTAELTDSLIIVQSEFIPSLSVSTSVTDGSYRAGSFSATINSNLDWQITEIPSWISTQQTTTGSGNKTINFAYTKNDGVRRIATIKVKNSVYNKVATITFTQTAPQLSDLSDGGSAF